MGTIELIVKIAAVILSFTGAFCLAMMFSRGEIQFRPAASAEDDTDDLKDKVYSFLLVDVNKTGANTDIFIAGINNDINSGKADYIHKILLLDGVDVAGFIDEIGNRTEMNPDGDEIERMCGIITEKYDNILYLKK